MIPATRMTPSRSADFKPPLLKLLHQDTPCLSVLLMLQHMTHLMMSARKVVVEMQSLHHDRMLPRWMRLLVSTQRLARKPRRPMP